eukprot:TRINITY_DN5505_c0_g1_i1.p1 TRINITY_DN5505_c0_g1~~TRINITY_DN5505_c0_g1_i1.p1  ORF type:complete len:226 (+),score=63.10 TRINITY_DN5505_c0_g1_i1:59-736(+)
MPSIVQLSGGDLPAEAVAAGAAALRAGKVIAVPTDTLYGVACCAADPEAVRRLYELKGRAQSNPVAVCVRDVSCISSVCDPSSLMPGLLDALLPGPFTVVLPRRPPPALPAELNPGLANIGIRVIELPVFSALLAELPSGAVALTSANRSGATSPLAVEDFAELHDGIEVCYDAGRIQASRQGSTVLDLSQCSASNPTYSVIRKGDGWDRLQEVAAKYGLSCASK